MRELVDDALETDVPQRAYRVVDEAYASESNFRAVRNYASENNEDLEEVVLNYMNRMITDVSNPDSILDDALMPGKAKRLADDFLDFVEEVEIDPSPEFKETYRQLEESL